MENSGEGKTYRKTPSQKRFWTPPPVICSRPAISFRGNRHRPDQSHLQRPPKLVLEGALYSTFSPQNIAGYVCPSISLTPDIPQSDIAATNFYDQVKNWAKFWTKFSGHFRASCAVQNDPPNFSPNSSRFITPCLVTAPVAEISKLHLRELLGLGVPSSLSGPISRNIAMLSLRCPILRDTF